ncbi:MAG: radical SAM family heme chaperone HemW [Terrimicrobiaceae bacterium]|nr:radical SAM family heme chaperone HemW [Terrimicrobiaceae bacterium]
MVGHLYVHIPFCPKVCPYCSFYKEASDRNKTRAFLEAVLTTAEAASEGLRPATVFFGGGTPTALSTSQLQFLIGGLRERIDFSAVEEFTIEMNPATVSLEKAEALRELGVNRVSMGVQSWDGGLLETLGRVHSAAQAERSYRILREAGIGNVNLDLIFGIPGQTEEAWRESIRRTIELEPEHVSAYCLTYEEDTEFFLRFQRGEMAPVEERDARFFEIAIDELEAAGFAQYEISNYARPGRECRHNLAYWQGAEYEGLGPSAFSTRGGRRRRNVADTAEFIRRVNAGEAAYDFEEIPDEATLDMERLAFELRTRDGIPVGVVAPVQLERLVAGGFLEERAGRVRLTRRGKLVADEVAAELI